MKNPTRLFANALTIGLVLFGAGCRSINHTNSLLASRPADYYTETHRPQFHFTPEVNWMNDPNGMVYHDGEYHLFYQYNPFGDRWGHMSWGHAVSRDMVHWEHLPVALYEEDGVMIFSGSAVVDHANTSGFGTEDDPPLVAIYTGHYTEKPLQNQHIAYSNDNGRTWTKYGGNPVLDIGYRDFRDPKVMWHEPSNKWVMMVTLPTERKVRLYGSPNLKDWTLLSEFGPAGAVKGIWECPDLFPLTVEGSGETKWVLIVNIGGDAIAGGSGCQYFVGEFDGEGFVEDPLSAQHELPETDNWVDYARDFYAAVSWSDVPKRDGRRLWLGWMSNWQYAKDVPTSPWRSAMSIPRSLSLRKTDDRWLLVQRPVRELESLRGEERVLKLRDFSGSRTFEGSALEKETFETSIAMLPSPDAIIELDLQTGDNESTTVTIDIPNRVLRLDRTRSGHVDFSDQFPKVFEAPIRLINGELRLRAFIDTSSVEFFVNGGESVMTSLILPEGSDRTLSLNVPTGTLNAIVKAWPLRSTWRR